MAKEYQSRVADKVIRTTELGDPVKTAFIGVLLDEDTKNISVYLRCKRHSEQIQLQEKAQMYASRGAELTDEQSQELLELIKKGALDPSLSRKFIVGEPIRPSLTFNSFTLTWSEAGHCYLKWRECQAEALYNIWWFIEKTRAEVNAYASYNNMVKALETVVRNYPQRIRFIESLSTDGTGYFRRNANG